MELTVPIKVEMDEEKLKALCEEYCAEVYSSAIDDMVEALIKAKRGLPLTDARIEEIGEELKEAKNEV